MKKEKRLEAIRKIISKYSIGSQEELLLRLNDLGFELTQATLSRDLKQLKVGRIPSENGFHYVISREVIGFSNTKEFSPIAYGFLEIEFSQNIAVIKTLPAYSHTIADAIDKSDIYEILGTVAGNDTIMVIIREGISHKQVINAIKIALPELKQKLRDDN